MKHLFFTIILALLSGLTSAKDYVPADFTWTSQSRNSSESMPCGGHDIGMNVWVENGDLLFYLSKSGLFDENNTLLKAGRIRLHIDGNSFGKNFSQTLCLDDGAIYVKGMGTSIRLWADVFSPVVFLEISNSKKSNVTLSYESWRYRDRLITKDEQQQCSWKWLLPKETYTFADSIIPSKESLQFYHQNRKETVFDFTVDYEHLTEIKSQLYNPIGGLRWGARICCPGLTFAGCNDGKYLDTDYRSWNYSGNVKTSVVSVVFEDGDSRINNKISSKRSARWWHEFWQRSWIQTDNDEAKNMVRNYELFRYMLGCNAYGLWPSKFNGSLFTFDPVFIDQTKPFSPDFRCWGGGTMTAQNQRLVYWPMLKSGDFDMMKSQFDTYLRMLPNAVARTQYCWGHDGASFTEQMENFGLPNPAEYGKHKDTNDYGTERNAWLEYLWDTSLEFCQMIMLAHSYGNLDIAPYEELISQCIKFFDLHYQYLAKQRGAKSLTGEGKLTIFPGSGAETYKMAYNPSSTIAALQTVLKTRNKKPETRNKKQETRNQKPETWGKDSAMLSRIPDIPLRVIGGDTCIAPAVAWERVQNVETPQLYPVFPWRIYGLGRPHIDIARNTYLKDSHAIEMRSSKGWKQDNIWAACLGLEDEAVRLNLEKWKDGPFRFPVFFDKGFDWTPDVNKGGAAMIGLQEMLLQEKPDGEIMLFPCWPKKWNCKFRLHATDGRIVEAEIKDGKIMCVN